MFEDYIKALKEFSEVASKVLKSQKEVNDKLQETSDNFKELVSGVADYSERILHDPRTAKEFKRKLTK